MHNITTQTTPHVDDCLSKKEFTQIISCTNFCKSLPLVVNIVAVAKFGAATVSYIQISCMFQSGLL